MTRSAHITHTPTGLALTFAEPVTRLDMAPDVAAHLASLLAVEAAHRMRGVVGTLAAENKQNRVTGGAGVNPDRAEKACTSVEPTSAPPWGARRLPTDHPHFCDCSPCLNGDPK